MHIVMPSFGGMRGYLMYGVTRGIVFMFFVLLGLFYYCETLFSCICMFSSNSVLFVGLIIQGY